MKKVFLPIFILILFSCSVVFKENSFLSRERVKVTITESDSFFYHIYFENIDDKKESYGKTISSLDSLAILYLFPGKYNIYVYGIVPKTEESFYIQKFRVLKEVEIITQNEIIISQLFDLYPVFNIEKYNSDNYLLELDLKEIYEMFSISSLSVKQNSDRTRSLTWKTDNESLKVYALIPFYQSGEWFMNISFSIKSKIDESELEKSGINLSTTYLKNIPLGNISN